MLMKKGVATKGSAYWPNIHFHPSPPAPCACQQVGEFRCSTAEALNSENADCVRFAAVLEALR